MSWLTKLRSALYRSNSVLGDVNAITKGPGAVAKRVVRKQAYKQLRGIDRMMAKIARW